MPQGCSRKEHYANWFVPFLALGQKYNTHGTLSLMKDMLKEYESSVIEENGIKMTVKEFLEENASKEVKYYEYHNSNTNNTIFYFVYDELKIAVEFAWDYPGKQIVITSFTNKESSNERIEEKKKLYRDLYKQAKPFIQ